MNLPKPAANVPGTRSPNTDDGTAGTECGSAPCPINRKCKCPGATACKIAQRLALLNPDLKPDGNRVS